MDLRSWPGTDWRRHGNRDAAASPAAAASRLGGGARAARGALGPAWHYRVGTSDLGRSCGACLPSAGSFIGLHVSSVYSDLSGTCTLTCAWHPPRGTAHGSAPSVALRLAGTSLLSGRLGARHRTAPGPPVLASGTRHWPAAVHGQPAGVELRASCRAGLAGLACAPCAWRPQPLAAGPPGLGGTRTTPLRFDGADPVWPTTVLATGAAEGASYSSGPLLAGSLRGRAARRGNGRH